MRRGYFQFNVSKMRDRRRFLTFPQAGAKTVKSSSLPVFGERENGGLTEIRDPSAFLIDASGYRGEAERVWAPESEAEAAAILRECSQTRTPVTIAGAGTGLTGGRVPEGGCVLSLHRLNRIAIREGSALCGAGALLADVQAKATASRQFY